MVYLNIQGVVVSSILHPCVHMMTHLFFSQPSVLMFMFPASCSSTSLKRLLPSWRTSMSLVLLHQLVFFLEAQNTWWSKVNLMLSSEERRYGLKQIVISTMPYTFVYACVNLPETNSVHACNTIVLMISTCRSIKGAILYQRCPGCCACCFSWTWSIIWWIPA